MPDALADISRWGRQSLWIEKNLIGPWTIYLSFAGALLEAILPKGRNGLARGVALVIATAGLVIAVGGFASFLSTDVEDIAKIKAGLVGVTGGLSFAAPISTCSRIMWTARPALCLRSPRLSGPKSWRFPHS